MSATATLDDWIRPGEVVPEILELARSSGPAGFTVEDLRLRGLFTANLGAPLGRLCAQGWLRVIGDEPSKFRTSKGRHVRRFAIGPEAP
ncbi:MAG TPA: hypothetical protein VGU43_04605 [Thermoplasmata archaeon]|nr:hypothetical protein [Thermoplasmata archaeon]